jgi:hypothetical protein
MARNESRALAGYYPFPPHLLPAVASLVAPCAISAQWGGQGPLQVLDPFAGDAAAILGLCSAWRHWKPEAVGQWRDKKTAPPHKQPQFELTAIELDHARSEQARKNIDLAANNGAVSTESRSLFGDAYRWTRRGDQRWCHLLYLNPPYDTHPVHRREEAAALLRYLPQLVDGGVLVAVFPATALDACADILANRAREGAMFFHRLPDPDFAAFQQLVIVARISIVEIPRPARAERIRTYGEFPEDLPPTLAVEPKALLEAPSPRYSAGSWVYRAVRPEEIVPLVRPLERVRGVAVALDQMVGQRVELAMPPRPAHIVMALVDGAFDGQVIRSPRVGLPPVLVKAIAGRQMVTVGQPEERETKEGKIEVVTKYVEVPSLRLHVMDMQSYTFLEPAPASLPSGATSLADMNIADFVLAYADPLASLMAELFVPLHAMRAEDLVELPPFARQLFPAQHHATSTALKLLSRHRAALLMAEIGTGKTTMATQIWGSLRPSAPMEVLGPRATFEPRHKIAMELEAMGFDTARLPSVKRLLVMCPPHLVRSWTKEVLASLPAAKVVEVLSIADFSLPADVFILSRERAKLSHGWRGVGAGFVAPHLPGGDAISRELRPSMTCPKCGRPADIPSWRRKRAIKPDDLAEQRATCAHQALPRTPIYRALDFLAQLLATWAPEGDAGQWATTYHPTLRRRLAVLKRRAEDAARAAHPEWRSGDGEPSIMPFIPKLGGGAMRSLSGSIKVVLRSLGGALQGFVPDAGWELQAMELAHLLESVGRAASAAGWKPETFRQEAERIVFGIGSNLRGMLEGRPAGKLVVFEAAAAGAAQVVIGLPKGGEIKGRIARRAKLQAAGGTLVVTADTIAVGLGAASLAISVEPLAFDLAAGAVLEVVTRPLHESLSGWHSIVMAHLSRDYHLQPVGTPLTIWSTVWTQLLETAGKTGAGAGEVCGERLYGAEPKPRRYSLARWMARYLPEAWWRETMLAIDEAHEMSNGETAQSLAGQRLANRAGCTLLLTGSVMSGYARSLFHVLRLASPEFAEEWRHSDEGRFVAAYGYSKFREVADAEKARSRRGKQSDRRQSNSMVRTGDAPGVAPGAVLRHVLPVAAVVHQEDLELSIPPMFEHEVKVPVDAGDFEMLDEWQRIELALIEAMKDIRIRKKLLWAMMKLPTYPDLGCGDVDPFVIQMPFDEDEPDAPRPIIVEAQLQPASYVTPKERWLIQFLGEQRALGRRSLVFVTHTGGGYPARLQRLLAAAGASCAYLDVKRVPAKDRDEWIEKRCGDVEVLICNPNAVRTGLNSLVAFSNAVWMEADYDARTYRQANGRIHRIGQVGVANVYYLYLPNSSQEDAKKLIAAKVEASLRVDGLDVASSLAMAGASDDDKAAAAVYADVAEMIYQRSVARRKVA